MKILAALLIVVGLFALAYEGITYKTREEVIDVGPIEVTQEKTHRVPVSPIIGGVAVAAGVGLLLLAKKR